MIGMFFAETDLVVSERDVPHIHTFQVRALMKQAQVRHKALTMAHVEGAQVGR